MLLITALALLAPDWTSPVIPGRMSRTWGTFPRSSRGSAQSRATSPPSERIKSSLCIQETFSFSGPHYDPCPQDYQVWEVIDVKGSERKSSIGIYSVVSGVLTCTQVSHTLKSSRDILTPNETLVSCPKSQAIEDLTLVTWDHKLYKLILIGFIVWLLQMRFMDICSPEAHSEVTIYWKTLLEI